MLFVTLFFIVLMCVICRTMW